MCVLGMEPWSSGRAASALDHWVISLAPDIWLGVEGVIMSKCCNANPLGLFLQVTFAVVVSWPLLGVLLLP